MYSTDLDIKRKLLELHLDPIFNISMRKVKVLNLQFLLDSSLVVQLCTGVTLQTNFLLQMVLVLVLIKIY